MIPIKIRAASLTCYVFDRNDGTTVHVEMDTLRRWKRAHDEWLSVQGEMTEAEKTANPPPEPVPLPIAGDETVAFDSRSYLGSGVANGIAIQPPAQHEQPKPVELPVPTEVSEPTTRVRRAYHKRKAHRPRPHIEDRPPDQETATSEIPVT